MNLPTGTVTFLFTDIEGSTRLWEQSPEAMRAALARHDLLLREAIGTNGGAVFKSVGDAVCAAFTTAPDALSAALAAQRALITEPWTDEAALRVRMALHTGAAEHRDGDYFGPPLNRLARLLATGHGGQILLSHVVHDLTRDVLPTVAQLKSLGEHRLRDLGHPESIFQLLHPDLPGDFPPLRSLDHPGLPNNLSQQVTSFVGREKEMGDVTRLLAATRLLTIVGTGGSGKTRLALHVAADLLGADGHEDGVWLAELAPLADPNLVPQTVAQALGVAEEAGRPLTQTLVDRLRAKRLLLLLDNCEHVLTACGQLADAVIRGCPRVTVLATSREALGVAGETTYRVPPLSLPDPGRVRTAEALSQYEAVRLFIERAAAVLPAFAVTNQNAPALAQICARLDGIPLAIELAAARVRVMPLDQLAARLDDRFRLLTGGSRTALPRQQTLRALIDWSYDLLNDRERLLLCRMSVFAGGWTLDEAEAVCGGDGVEDWEVLDLLTGLVDKSLVVYEEQNGTGRYRLLETVRQYAAEKLSASGVAAVKTARERHREQFRQLAQQAGAHLDGPEQIPWLDRLEVEHDNLRAALDDCAADPQGADTGLRIAAALRRFWHTRGYLTEGRDRYRTLLARAEAQELTPSRAAALEGAGILAFWQGDYEAARIAHEESLRIRRQHGDIAGIVTSLIELACVVREQGEQEAAETMFQEALAVNLDVRDRREEGRATMNLAISSFARGDYETARVRGENALTMLREVGDPRLIAFCLFVLGMIAVLQGDVAAARAHLTDGVGLALELRDAITAYTCLMGFALLFLARQQPLQTARLLGAEHAQRRGLGASLNRTAARVLEQVPPKVRAVLGDEAFTAAWDEGQAMSLSQAISYALTEAEPQTQG